MQNTTAPTAPDTAFPRILTVGWTATPRETLPMARVVAERTSKRVGSNVWVSSTFR